MTADLIVIDTQLQVLLAVGTACTAYIARHERTTSRRYSEVDFKLLSKVIDGKTLIFVPHVLQETYYFLTRCRDPMRAHILEVFEQPVRTVEERPESSAAGVDRPEFRRLAWRTRCFWWPAPPARRC